MGCCGSRIDNPGSGLSNSQSLPHDSSRAAINAPSPSQPSHEFPPPSSNRRTGAGATTSSSRVRPNQPILPPTPLLKSPKNVSNNPPPWTRSHLNRQREIFFETRVTGREEIWQTLRLVCEFLRQEDVEQAQAVLNAANITCPHGRVARGRGKERHREGVYDESGQLYELPYWVVTDPQDIIEDEGEEMEKEVDGTGSEDGEEDFAEGETIGTAAEGEERREEKGKGRAEDIGEPIKVRARLSNSSSDIEVMIGARQNVGVMIRQIKQKMPEVKHMRLVYYGKALDESKTLEAQGWKKGHVLNAFVFEGDEVALDRKLSKRK